MSKKSVFLCCSLDVEEEGLFRGAYRAVQPPVENLAHLGRLAPLISRGVRPTLFCDWPVLESDGSWAHVAELLERHPVEAGTHLHHWNTPPLKDGDRTLASVPSASVDQALMLEKLECLQDAAARRLGRRPSSFRMGRWDLHRKHWPLLARVGITADASVRPLHAGNGKNLGPDHYDAPREPYVVNVDAGTDGSLGNVQSREGQPVSLFELPLTVTDLVPALSKLVGGLGQNAKAGLHQWGALALLPVYHPLWAMKIVTALSVARGNPVLSLTWHSSELMPGGNPRMPKPVDIDAFLDKVTAYLDWLEESYEVEYATLGELSARMMDTAPRVSSSAGDWAPAPMPTMDNKAVKVTGAAR